MPADKTTPAQLARIEALTEVLARSVDAEVRTSARDLVRIILDLHRDGIARMLDHLGTAGAAGQAIIADLARDTLVSNLLLLHDLHPDALEQRVRQALDELRPRLCSQHGEKVELVAVVGETVKVRLSGGCWSCPSSASKLRKTVEDSILAVAPNVAAVEVETTVEDRAMPLANLVLLPVISRL